MIERSIGPSFGISIHGSRMNSLVGSVFGSSAASAVAGAGEREREHPGQAVEAADHALSPRGSRLESAQASPRAAASIV